VKPGPDEKDGILRNGAQECCAPAGKDQRRKAAATQSKARGKTNGAPRPFARLRVKRRVDTESPVAKKASFLAPALLGYLEAL